MTSRVSPKECELHRALGARELCPGASCAFWEEGGSILEAGCAIERLGIPVERSRELATHLLDLRRAVEGARTAAERDDARRRFAELLNVDGE